MFLQSCFCKPHFTTIRTSESLWLVCCKRFPSIVKFYQSVKHKPKTVLIFKVLLNNKFFPQFSSFIPQVHGRDSLWTPTHSQYVCVGNIMMYKYSATKFSQTKTCYKLTNANYQNMTKIMTMSSPKNVTRLHQKSTLYPYVNLCPCKKSPSESCSKIPLTVIIIIGKSQKHRPL